jgi:hypothetical protein
LTAAKFAAKFRRTRRIFRRVREIWAGICDSRPKDTILHIRSNAVARHPGGFKDQTAPIRCSEIAAGGF